MSENPRASESDAELLYSMRRSACEELQFFSNKGKEARERWVVSRFLQCRSITFRESELTSPHQQSKIDVHFRNANFQIKEILNPGSKRGGEIKAIYNRLKAARTLEDVIGPAFVYDVPPPTTIYALLYEEAERLSLVKKYSAIKGEIDLLFYITRTHASMIRQEEIENEQLKLLGWRSISCLAGDCATVLYARTDAPRFLLDQ